MHKLPSVLLTLSTSDFDLLSKKLQQERKRKKELSVDQAYHARGRHKLDSSSKLPIIHSFSFNTHMCGFCWNSTRKQMQARTLDNILTFLLDELEFKWITSQTNLAEPAMVIHRTALSEMGPFQHFYIIFQKSPVMVISRFCGSPMKGGRHQVSKLTGHCEQCPS